MKKRIVMCPIKETPIVVKRKVEYCGNSNCLFFKEGNCLMRSHIKRSLKL